MHDFSELITCSMSFSLGGLERVNNEILKNLESSASTNYVKNLQMVQMHKVVLAVGMFSIFDAELQKNLSCTNGFKKAREILLEKNEIELEKRLENFILAINVLKHGQGKSYNILKTKGDLPFVIAYKDSGFFIEGDVSEIDTLIKVDDGFVIDCANLITKISNAVSG